MEEPREWLLVCSGALLHPERAREKSGDHADPHQGEPQGGQTLWVSLGWPTLPPEEANPLCRLHAHQGTLLLRRTMPGVHSSWEATDHLLMNQFFFWHSLLKYPEILKDFNFRKVYWFNRKETFWCCLMFSEFSEAFFFFFFYNSFVDFGYSFGDFVISS